MPSATMGIVEVTYDPNAAAYADRVARDETKGTYALALMNADPFLSVPAYVIHVEPVELPEPNYPTGSELRFESLVPPLQVDDVVCLHSPNAPAVAA